MQRWAVISLTLVVLVSAEQCPDGGACEQGQTCCNSPATGYGCCPFQQAECCADHVHCCPAATICDPSTSSCVNNTVSIPWAERTSTDQPALSKSFRMIKSYMGEEHHTICPDQSQCPANFSCLRALTKFGCCPLVQGIPCSDGKHCCPEGNVCTADSRSCVRKESVSTVLCGDGVSECPDESTCCETSEGQWGCCPMPKAVCCEDKVHCCPEGSRCDVQQSTCVSMVTKKLTPMWAKFPARTRAEWENPKEGEHVTAKAAEDEASRKVPELTTQSALPVLEEDASSVTKADAVTITTPSQETTREEEKEKEVERAETQEDWVQCDSHTTCPQTSTCCYMTDLQKWGCCPLQHAVCCKDGRHCCPSNYKCKEDRMVCVKGLLEVPWYTKLAATTTEEAPPTTTEEAPPSSTQCDGKAQCPERSTCCQLPTGQWGCCPLMNALCCPDQLHCCPQGFSCNVASQSCQKLLMLQLESLPLTPLFLPQPSPQIAAVRPKNIQCDETTSCPDGDTCCKTSATTWGCCPSPDAVCCSDMKHCCPAGFTCTPEGQCTMTDSQDWGHWKHWDMFVPKSRKNPTPSPQIAAVHPKNVQCDETTSCPDGDTCCKTSATTWGCCPSPDAVCCSDMKHCCPTGFTCTPEGQCTMTDSQDWGHWKHWDMFVPKSSKNPTPSPQIAAVHPKNIQCDETTSCPDGDTCCKTSATTWGCCPSPDAVCCSDMKHCCPTGFTCTPEGQCTMTDSQDWGHWKHWDMFVPNSKKKPTV